MTSVNTFSHLFLIFFAFLAKSMVAACIMLGILLYLRLVMPSETH
jgi:hypothetical protein